MKTETFTSKNGMELIIKSRKSAVIFEMNPAQLNGKHAVDFDFDRAVFESLVTHIETVAYESWWTPTFGPKEAQSAGADYDEYYDRELDNNGSLSLRGITFRMNRPALDNVRLYQFNKRKMESFLYDLKKIVVLPENTGNERIVQGVFIG